MDRLPIPLVILGGRDSEPANLPDAGREKHPLHGYKGADLEIGGKPLVLGVAEAMAATGAFHPILVAGPERIYGGLRPHLDIIDTDGDFGRNLRAVLEWVLENLPPSHLGVTTCDILPRPDELAAALEDYYSRLPCDFWAPQIHAPGDRRRLGESAWKPQYHLAPREGASPVRTLPGHLVILDPVILRRRLLYRMFNIAYRTRNRSVSYRRSVMLPRILGTLLVQDLKLVASLKPPVATWEIVTNGLAIAHGLRDGTLSVHRLAALLRRLFIRRSHRRRYPERRGHLPVLEGLSLAKDIDTREEALEADRLLHAARVGP